MIAAASPVWVTSRAAGIAALLFASLSVALGVLMSNPAVRKRLGGLELRVVHEALALGTLALVAVHGIALALDPVLKAGLAGVVIPFAGPFRPLGTAAGQFAAFGLAGLGLTYYVRGRIGPARWRKAHRLIPAFWALAVIHGLTVGTDATSSWVLLALAPPVLAAALLAGDRLRARLGAAQTEAAPASPAIRRRATTRPMTPRTTRTPTATFTSGADRLDRLPPSAT
jgi:methionine sulfoxide reductase heme-binding subunit